MKKLVSFIVLVFISAFIITNAKDISVVQINTSAGTVRQRAPMLIPVTVDLSETDIYLSFTNSVGIANITITNSTGSIEYQESTDTNSDTEVYIPVDNLEAGNYTITISYGSITLKGVFTIE